MSLSKNHSIIRILDSYKNYDTSKPCTYTAKVCSVLIQKLFCCFISSLRNIILIIYFYYSLSLAHPGNRVLLSLFVPQLLRAADISSELCKKWQSTSVGNDKGFFSSGPLVRNICAAFDNNFRLTFILISFFCPNASKFIVCSDFPDL